VVLYVEGRGSAAAGGTPGEAQGGDQPVIPSSRGQIRRTQDHAELRDEGWTLSETTVAPLMREQGLAARRRKRRGSTTRPGRGRWRAPDVVKRDFAAEAITQKW
jgi:transposase InsO family protein